MTNSIKNVCVYSSSSNFLDTVYYKDAKVLGTLMGEAGFDLIYGGSVLGTMGENAKAVKKSGGKVVAVIPEKLYEICEQYDAYDKLYVTKGMRERKDKLDELSDAVVALAGGFGTLEELSEMIVQKQLGYNDKAIVILNTNGFYTNLLKFFDDIITQNFSNQKSRELCYIAKSPQEVIEYLKTYNPEHFELGDKLHLKKID